MSDVGNMLIYALGYEVTKETLLAYGLIMFAQAMRLCVMYAYIHTLTSRLSLIFVTFAIMIAFVSLIHDVIHVPGLPYVLRLAANAGIAFTLISMLLRIPAVRTAVVVALAFLVEIPWWVTMMYRGYVSANHLIEAIVFDVLPGAGRLVVGMMISVALVHVFRQSRMLRTCRGRTEGPR